MLYWDIDILLKKKNFELYRLILSLVECKLRKNIRNIDCL